jgi:UDP-N-acetylmuramyl tripeptide synthase
MGEVAGRKADYAIITTDNLYPEEPTHVARQIVQGIAGDPTPLR